MKLLQSKSLRLHAKLVRNTNDYHQVQVMQKQFEQLKQARNLRQQWINDFASKLKFLEILTKNLPEQVYLTAITFDDKQILVIGHSPTQTDLNFFTQHLQVEKINATLQDISQVNNTDELVFKMHVDIGGKIDN